MPGRAFLLNQKPGVVGLYQPVKAMVRSSEGLLIEVIPTIVQAVVSCPPSYTLFSSEPTESIHTVVEVHVDDRFTKLDRSFYDRTAVISRAITNRESSTEEPLI